jgi:pimeloyl-ACP methyl ester carboxylesterase
MSNIARLPSAAKPTVIALHCSGASGRAWRQLGQTLGNRFSLIAPDLIGNGTTGPWNGERAFTLADEAALAVKIIDAAERPVHLVGHSYGGGVALRAARERPRRVASLTLYEPTAFHVLKTLGADGRMALDEIRNIAGDLDRNVLSGAYRAAARQFVDYWAGEGSWAALRAEAQAELVRYVPKSCLDFRALIGERTPLAAYRRFNFPILLLQGERASEPVRLIARQLVKAMRFASFRIVYGAGHMGPFSHPEVVSAMMTDYIAHAEPHLDAAENDLAAPVRSAA